MLKNLTKANVVEIPYKGGVLAVQDLLGQQIHFIFSDALPAMQHIRAGKLRALCATGRRTLRAARGSADLRLGGPGPGRRELVGGADAAGTPRPIADKFHADIVR
jgi:hypothetical protein